MIYLGLVGKVARMSWFFMVCFLASKVKILAEVVYFCFLCFNFILFYFLFKKLNLLILHNTNKKLKDILANKIVTLHPRYIIREINEKNEDAVRFSRRFNGN